MSIYHDEIEIEDMEYDEETETYTYPCPCGDIFEITKEELESGEVEAKCPSCSLLIKVIYNIIAYGMECDSTSGPSMLGASGGTENNDSTVTNVLMESCEEISIPPAQNTPMTPSPIQNTPMTPSPMTPSPMTPSPTPNMLPVDVCMVRSQELQSHDIRLRDTPIDWSSESPDTRLHDSILRDVLNNKKMELLRSPEVQAFFQNHQERVRESHTSPNPT